LKLSNACALSLALHGAPLLVWLGLNLFGAQQLVAPPSSSIHARLLTYQYNDDVKEVENQDISENRQAPEVEKIANELKPAVISSPVADVVKPAQPATATIAASNHASDVVDASLLSSPPGLLSQVVIEYPPQAQNREGTVTLDILISGTGDVLDIQVVTATTPGFFEAAAIAGFKNAKFSPGLLGGLGVKTRTRIEVEFMPTNRGGAVSGQR